MSQQVGGNASTMKVPTASNARNILQNVENLYNLALVDRVFEDGSIPSSKINGGAIPSLHAATHSKAGTDEVTVENLATANLDTTYALKPDGAGGVAFAAIGGGGAFSYTGGIGLYGENNANTVANDSIQIGNGAAASGGVNSIAIGLNSVASYYGAMAIGGKGASATAYGLAVGSYTKAHASGTTAIGHTAEASANFASAFGSQSEAAGVESLAVGNGSYARNVAVGGIAIGTDANQQGIGGVCIGHLSRVNFGHDYSIAIGKSVNSIAANTVTFGVSNTSKISFGQFTPAAATPAASHTLDVTISGSVYKLLLST